MATKLPDDAEATHRKRLAQILRYISNMHTSAADELPFVRQGGNGAADYFQGVEERILFTTSDFRRIAALNSEQTLSPPPFSFYSSSGKFDSRKRNRSGSIQDDGLRPCWLRLTRLGSERPPSRKSPAVRDYLQTWEERSGLGLSELLTLPRLTAAPKCHPSMSLPQQGEIKAFLRQSKAHLKRSTIRREVEPLYNRVFECLQSHENEDLVWGLGNARQQLEGGDVVNGPLLEVLVEIELARDGALLLRPRQHTGVHLNTQVMSALSRSTEVITAWHRTVSELETCELSPGEPQTYSKLLKGLAVEVSPDGTFVSAPASRSDADDPRKLVVTDDWCLYLRPKPSTVWARDASTLAEKVMGASSLPMASWSLTHGPAALDLVRNHAGQADNLLHVWDAMKSIFYRSAAKRSDLPKPLLPLPTSETQNQIAELLLEKHVPAVVCEGPPGSGKSQTIANIVCAYLSQGKRVLVTSKGAPALSVLRNRLPVCVQELCVDVSMSESQGMRQLQQTVERLSDRISGLNANIQEERWKALQLNIHALETEMASIDAELENRAERKRLFVHSEEGRHVMDLAISMMNDVPWMLQTLRKLSEVETLDIAKRSKKMFIEPSDIIERVSGFSCPISGDLISLVASRAGETLSSIRTSLGQFVSSVPFVGNLSGFNVRCAQLTESVGCLRIDNRAPSSISDWAVVCSALRRERDIDEYIRSTIEPLITKYNWPVDDVMSDNCGRRRLHKDFIAWTAKLSDLKALVWRHGLTDTREQADETMQLDFRRAHLASLLPGLLTELVEVNIVTQLSQMFDVEAQRELIRFAQVAARAKFGKSTQLNKLSQRQRRHRQEYLDAFERCVRFIPCWILTSSQISDYLPADFDLFDLVVLDEASQSDVTALPGILRGKQWLIVGDGKQVSPTEAFVSEEYIDNLRAAVPESPFEGSLLPGCSFFDLCSQAFPQGRAVLREHFRCAPEIIAFSNTQFYNGRLVPLRLPTSQERLSPSIVDIEVDGSKVGKINEMECDKIVDMIRDQVLIDDGSAQPRSIGVISLLGDEQSRLIRGRLLDVIGPQKMKEHEILVGEPPSFQGAERDIVFLSMVCSPGSVPAQTQLMHAQRVNVALSRARDRLVLVRSINTNHVSNSRDIKIPIIEFFAQQTDDDDALDEAKSTGIYEHHVSALFRRVLERETFCHCTMGNIWSKGICVESLQERSRAAVIIEAAGESIGEWKQSFQQQKSIERVGWKTLRVDALSLLLDHQATMHGVKEFLASAGVERTQPIEEAQVDNAAPVFDEDDEDDVVIVEPMELQHAEVVIISSDDDGDSRAMVPLPLMCMKEEDDDRMDPSNFGDVVDLMFLRAAVAQDEVDDEDEAVAGGARFSARRFPPVAGRRQTAVGSGDDDSYLGDQSEMEGNPRPAKRQKRKGYKRLDKYSRDARYGPGTASNASNDDDWFYDTDDSLVKVEMKEETRKS